MIAAMATSTSLLFSPLQSRTAGTEANFVLSKFSENQRHFRASVYFGLHAIEVLDALCATFQQCNKPNWDGYGAAPVLDDTYQHTWRFIESLPWGTPGPSVGAEPDGHLTLEWHRSPHRTVSVSVSPDGDLHYAALLGISKAYGSEPFFGEMPTIILDLINRVCA